jgi:hypothetical protein
MSSKREEKGPLPSNLTDNYSFIFFKFLTELVIFQGVNYAN